MENTRIASPTVGLALMASGIALAAASILEFAPGAIRGDGDNPEDSLNYLAQFGDFYLYSGLALALGGLLLVVAVIGIYRMLSAASLAFTASSAFGVLAGGFVAATGVMRMQATGTVPHIESLSEAWGQAAYLAVQMAGTQGLLSTGVIALAGWLVAVALVLARHRLRVPALLAVFPATALLVLVSDLIFPSFADNAPDYIFLAYVAAAILGMPACCVGFGITLLFHRVRQRLVYSGEKSQALPGTRER